jgi:hypothetical protein
MMHENHLPLVKKNKNGIHSSESYKSLVKQQRTDVKDCAKISAGTRIHGKIGKHHVSTIINYSS